MSPDIAYSSLAPMLVVFGVAIVSVLVEAFVPARRRYVVQLTLYLGGLAGAFAAVVMLAGTTVETAEGSVAVDGPALFLQGLTVLVAIGAGLLIGERIGTRAAAWVGAGSGAGSGARSGAGTSAADAGSRGPGSAGVGIRGLGSAGAGIRGPGSAGAGSRGPGGAGVGRLLARPGRVLAGFAPQAAVAPGGDAERDAERAGVMQTEVFPLALFATGGLMLFPAASDLITLFIALEVLSLPLYVLCGMARRRRLLSQEAAVKYFLLGAFSSAFFVYGVALLYGYAGTVTYRGIAAAVRTEGDSGLALVGIAMLSVGLLFKVGAVPFHTWTPDVYQGAPTSITAFMAAGTKIAAFGAILRFFYTAVPRLEAAWTPVLWMIAALTMIVGTVVGVTQNDVKRLLAYSSVAHAGFLLTAVIGFPAGASALLFYLAAYGVSTIGVFAVAGLVRDPDGAEIGDLRDWSGIGRRQPLVAGLFALFLLALAGIPLTSGFIAKFAVFSAAVDGGAVTLVVIGVLTSAIAASFYVRVIVVMFFREPEDASGSGASGSGGDAVASGGAGVGAAPGETSDSDASGEAGVGAAAGGTSDSDAIAPVAFAHRPVTLGVVGVAAVITLALGIMPQPLLDLAEAAEFAFWF